MVEEHQTVVGTCLLLMGSTPACRYSPPDGPSVVMPEHKSCPAPAPISKLSSALRRPVSVNVVNTAGSSGKLDVWWQIVLQLIRQITVMLKTLTGFGWKIPRKHKQKDFHVLHIVPFHPIHLSHTDINIPIPWMSGGLVSSSLSTCRLLEESQRCLEDLFWD